MNPIIEKAFKLKLIQYTSFQIVKYPKIYLRITHISKRF